MLELHQLLSVLAPALGANINIIEEIIKGIYGISSGGVTMKNIARWTGKKGSYRNIQRFFAHSNRLVMFEYTFVEECLYNFTEQGQIYSSLR